MNKTHIILLSGRGQSGKSSSTSHLTYEIENTYNSAVRVVKYSCAAKLKKFLHEVMNVDYDLLYGSDEEKNKLTHLRWATLPMNGDVETVRNIIKAKDATFLTGRETMEVFGSYICRRWWPDCWANALVSDIQADSHPHIAIVDDIRFPNEVEYVTPHFDTTIIRLTRNPLNRSSISETALDQFDWAKYDAHVIHNNGECPIESKNAQLNEILRGVMEKL